MTRVHKNLEGRVKMSIYNGDHERKRGSSVDIK